MGPGVLVVNSNPGSRMRIAAVLSTARFDVVSCATAAEALALLRIAPREAIVVASTLDDMGGIEFIHACTALGFAPTVIMTTQRGEIPAAVSAVRVGAHDYLTEPIDERLPQSLRKALLDATGRTAPHPPAGGPGSGGEGV